MVISNLGSKNRSEEGEKNELLLKGERTHLIS
jgi:hypothetical protein